MQFDARVENGELRGAVTGPLMNFDSPNMFIQQTRSHYVAMRMMYYGAKASGRLIVRSGAEPTNRLTLDHSRNYWYNEINMKIIDSSEEKYSSGNCSKELAADGDPYTYYLSQSSSMAYLIIDMGSFRWVSSITILGTGDSDSPKNCVLLKSLSSGVGPFETVTSFAMADSLVNVTGSNETYRDIKEQVFGPFKTTFARYFKLLIVDNYGGSHVGVRDVSFSGFNEQTTSQTFDIANDAKYNMYYIPVSSILLGPLLRMRFEIIETDKGDLVRKNQVTRYSQGIAIDYIRVARAPDIRRVTGCIDVYYDDSNFSGPKYNVTKVVTYINDNLPVESYAKGPLTDDYASTFDCPPAGGVNVTVEGLNFGPSARVLIAGRECVVTSHSITPVSEIQSPGRVEKLVCTLPSALGLVGPQPLRVQNGVMPGLFQESSVVFAYRSAPPVPATPIVVNIGARKVDLVWEPPGNHIQHLAVTGYRIIWFKPQFRTRVSNMTVSNITRTSVKGLEPNTEYVFAIAAISEGATHERAASLPTDLYGRRDVANNGFISTFSDYANITATLPSDFTFNFFNANKTINSSSVPGSINTNGPTGQYGSEGHFGLVLVGSTNIQNCNVSSTCCDGYNATIGLASCGTTRSVCAVLPKRMLAYDFVINGVTRRQVPSNLPYEDEDGKVYGLPEVVMLTLDELAADKGADLPSVACGPALRLTPSEARQSGSAWYRRKVNVKEGFDTTIKFEISNPSQRCDRLDDVNTYCRSRGADGFAFVIQNVGFTSLGNAGSGLGYEGIDNALAIEFDTYHNYENMDFYENHIAIMTQGFRYNITANHSRALATTNRCPDLTDGIHTIRIRYDPTFDENAVPHPSFQVNGFSSWFLENGDFKDGGQGDWGVGFGLLYVYIDDLYSPVITTPINLDKTIDLEDGRAIVGFTAATGDNLWQAHDILEWSFSSLYIDDFYEPPVVINGLGDQYCRNETECRHLTDFDHYMRRNFVPYIGADNTEGWMTGTEGLNSD